MMTETHVSLIEPLVRGWRTMTEALFRPFDPGRWLVLAFAAWLAGLANGGRGGGFNFSSDDGGRDLAHGARSGWEWLQSHQLVAGLIVAGLLTALALVVLVIWISSRGKFVFLDNVVHNRAVIAEPWRRCRRLGNSLFAFRLIVGLICLPLVLGFGGLFAWLAFGPGGWSRLEGPALLAGMIGTGFIACLLIIATVYTVFFLNAFVVPLMHRFDLGVVAAWRRFFTLLRGNLGWFLLCGLFVFMLTIAAFVAIVTTGFLTCCLGFVLLVLPYVSTVVLLPLLVTYRAFTVEFLAQFEPDLLAGPASASRAGALEA